jgi:hypothetical protein
VRPERKVYATFVDWVQVSPDYDMDRRPRIHEVQPGETVAEVVAWYRRVARYTDKNTYAFSFTIVVEEPTPTTATEAE